MLEFVGKTTGIDRAVCNALSSSHAAKLLTIARFWASTHDTLPHLEKWQIMHETPYPEGISEDCYYHSSRIWAATKPPDNDFLPHWLLWQEIRLRLRSTRRRFLPTAKIKRRPGTASTKKRRLAHAQAPDALRSGTSPSDRLRLPAGEHPRLSFRRECCVST